MNLFKIKKRNRLRIMTGMIVLLFMCPLMLWGQSMGDVNADGYVTIVDALMVSQACVGLSPQGFEVAYADVDGNGSITIIDGLMIAQYVVGLLPAFPGGPQVTPTPGPGMTTSIVFHGGSISANGGGVSIDGSSVTIIAGGTYEISGTLTDGGILVDSEDENPVVLILKGIDVFCSNGSPLVVMEAEETRIVLADGTYNYLKDSSNYIFPDPEENEPNATLFSKDDLIIEGNGFLEVSANYNDGITSKDGLIILGGTIEVTAVDDGIRGKDFIRMDKGNVIVHAGGDGLKSDDKDEGSILISDGIINVTSEGDALQAEIEIRVTGGNVTLLAGGGHNAYLGSDDSAKGLKGLVNTVIYGGTFNIDTADDSIHSNQNVTIHGGIFTIATGDDAIHSDKELEINGGDIYVTQSYEGIESAYITINDGNMNINADDDGVNAAGGEGESRPGQPGDFYLYINGGYLSVNISAETISGSTGGDGLDCNGHMYINGGTSIVHGGTNIDSAVDYDGSFTMNGGLLVGAGTSMMAMGPQNSSAQNGLLYNFSNQSGNSLIHIQSSNGVSILTFAPNKQYSSLVFSSPELKNGTTYQIYLGGSATGTISDGLYLDGQYTPGTLAETFTVTNRITNIGNSGFPGFPGFPGW